MKAIGPVFSRLVFAGLILVSLCGWDFSRHGVPLNEIQSGGPPKDGIPALTHPEFVSADEAEAELLKPTDRVLGLFLDGIAKAYPIKILNWHEIVNDRIGDRPVVVTFCPLCGTGMVFDAIMDGAPGMFGVSGLLYRSDMLMYDHRTESLWSQIRMEAVAGPMTGRKLKLIASTHTTWARWRAAHPETRVLSMRTGFRRDYGRDPYADYQGSPDLMFEVGARNGAYPAKEWVIGVEIGGVAKAYPFSTLSRIQSPVRDRVGPVEVEVSFDRTSRTAAVRDGKGNEIPTVTGFWFAWFAFHPDTKVFAEKSP